MMQLCPTHEMSTRLCGCGQPPVVPVEAPVRERERDFTAEREGMRLRTPFAGCVVVRCPECGQLGAYCTTGKRGQRRAVWVHEAVVSYVGEDCKGYTAIEQCGLIGDKFDAWLRARRRAARKQPRAEVAS